MKKISIGAVLFSLFLAFFATVAPARNAEAATWPTDVTGWAYSSNIGWISLNSKNPETPSNGYTWGVQTSADGTLGGYGWASNLGWVSFNSDAVSAGCGTRAYVSSTTGYVSGSFLAKVTDECGRLSDGNPGVGPYFPTGHADGSRGVTYNTSNGNLNGFAWGGQTIGWLKFMANIVPPTGADGLSVSCSPSSIHAITEAGNVTFTATASGGSGATPQYQYSWDGGTTFGTTATKVVNYTTEGGPGPNLVVKDMATNQTANASVSCANVIMATPNPGGGGNNPSEPPTPPETVTADLALRIGGTPENALSNASNSYMVKKGGKFALVWDINLDEAYVCTSLIDNGGSAYWGSDWNVSNVSGRKSKAGLSTDITSSGTAIKTGTYGFMIKCSDIDKVLPNKEVKSTLKIYSSTLDEI